MADKDTAASYGCGFSRHQEDEREFLEGTSLDTLAVSSKPKLKGVGLGTPIVPSIAVSSIHRYNDVDDFAKSLSEGYAYPRLGNHSSESAAHVINALEGGAGTAMFPAGMSAISITLLALLKAGDHVIAPNPAYSGSYAFMKSFLTKFGVETTFVESGNLDAYRKAIKPNTKIMYGETPTNPKLGLLDLSGFSDVTKEAPGALSMVDSTFGTPYLQQPLKLGVDIVVHSCSKYLGGHSDLVAGVVCCKDHDVFETIRGTASELGGCLSPFDSFLVMRGIRTLPVRMDRHCKNAMKIAQFLEQHPKVSYVAYPGLSSHPQHEIAKKQMKDFGGMVVFEMAGGKAAAKTTVEAVKLINLAPSLGGPESLIEHPATMTHGDWSGITDKEREEQLITPGLIRFSVGLEDAGDLIKDLTQALEKA